MAETDMLQRLERLERENRRMKRVGVAALSFLGAGVLMGLSASKDLPPKAIVAQSFVVVDPSGRPRAILAATPTEASLVLGGSGLGGGVRIVAASYTDKAPTPLQNSGELVFGPTRHPSIGISTNGTTSEITTANIATKSFAKLGTTAEGSGVVASHAGMRADLTAQPGITGFGMYLNDTAPPASWVYSSAGFSQHAPSGRVVDLNTGMVIRERWTPTAADASARPAPAP